MFRSGHDCTSTSSARSLRKVRFHCAYPNPVPRLFLLPIRQFLRRISLYFFAFSIFKIMFGVSVASCSGSLRSSSLVLPLLSNTELCDDDDGEMGESAVEVELADKPRTTSGTQLDFLQSSFAIPSEMWFLTAGPVVCMPTILTEFLQKSNAGVCSRSKTVTKKFNCLTYTVASLFPSPTQQS